MKITIINDPGGDWMALYKDGRNVHEGHSCSLEQGLKCLGIEFESDEVEVDDDLGNYPEELL